MRKLLLFSVVALVALGVSAAAMTLDEALGLFVAGDINVPYSDEGQAQIEEMKCCGNCAEWDCQYEDAKYKTPDGVCSYWQPKGEKQ